MPGVIDHRAGDAPPTIACIGDIDLDWLMVVDRLPSADDKIPARDLKLCPGGMAANAAVTISRLGGSSRLIGCVGDDAEGREVLGHLAREGVDLAHVSVSPGQRTFRCLVFIGPRGERALVRLPSALIVPTSADIHAAALAGCDHAHLTFGKPDVVAHVGDLARRLGLSLSVDLEEADLPQRPADLSALLEHVDLAFMNRRARAAADEVLDGRAVACAVVTTLGADGARFEAGDRRLESPGIAIGALDTTGAGDAFAGTFLVRWLADRDDPRAALDEANQVAAGSTRAIGAQSALPDGRRKSAGTAQP